MNCEDSYYEKNELMEELSFVFNESMTVANIDEPAEDESKVGVSSQSVGDHESIQIIYT